MRIQYRVVAGLLVAACAGCIPRTVTHRPPIHPTVTISTTTGVPGIVLFGETEAQITPRFDQRLFVDEDDHRSWAYDGVYALIYYSDDRRQMERLIFDFARLQEHGVELTVRIVHNNRTVVVRRSTTPQDFERLAGCKEQRIPGRHIRPDGYMLVPISADIPCLATSNPSNAPYYSEYKFTNSYTVASFSRGQLDRLYVFDTALLSDTPP